MDHPKQNTHNSDKPKKETKPKKGDLKRYEGLELLAMRKQLIPDRDIFTFLRETCRFFFSPNDHNSYTQNSNIAGKRTPQNPVGIQAARDLTSGLFSNTINIQDEFFGFRLADKELADNEKIKDWFAKCSETTIAKLAASNFILSSTETIHDYVIVNTAVQYSEMTKNKGIRFHNFMVDHCAISEDKDGRVDTIFRDFQLTACQAYEKWGEKLPEKIMAQYKDPNQKYTKTNYIHCVFPRLDYEKKFKKLRKEGTADEYEVDKKGEIIIVPEFEGKENMKYASYYILEEDGSILDEGGYRNFPYAVPRQQTNLDSNPYGRGISFMVKGLMASLDILSANISDGIELKVNPPLFLFGTQSDQNGIDLYPGAVNYLSAASADKPFFYQSDIDIAGATLREEKLEKQIREMFYNDLFKMLEDHKNMTATEVAARVAEKIQLILPVIARLYDELYSVTLSHVFHLLLEADVFTEMPQELAEIWDQQELRIEFTTRLDQKLAAIEISQILTAIDQIAKISEYEQNAPSIMSIIKSDWIKRDIARKNGIHPDGLKSEEETKAWREQQEANAQEVKMMEAAATGFDKINLQKPVDPSSLMGQQAAATAGAAI